MGFGRLFFFPAWDRMVFEVTRWTKQALSWRDAVAVLELTDSKTSSQLLEDTNHSKRLSTENNSHANLAGRGMSEAKVVNWLVKFWLQVRGKLSSLSKEKNVSVSILNGSGGVRWLLLLNVSRFGVNSLLQRIQSNHSFLHFFCFILFTYLTFL